MTLRPEIIFNSGFPNDAVYDGDGFADIQPGRNVAQTLRAALTQLDYRVSDPINGGDHGWELDIWRGRKRLWLQISVIGDDENYLLAENMTLWFWPDQKLFRTFLSDLKSVLDADSRFGRIGWLPKGGIARGLAPAAGPFDA